MSARTVTAETRGVLDRIGSALADRPLREVPMFGTIAVMLDDSMLVAVGKDRSLLVRVTPDDDAALIVRDDASRAEMGAGRSMGTGWIRVHSHAVEDEETLGFWLNAALRRLRSGPDAPRTP